jgi:hypothetical protein
VFAVFTAPEQIGIHSGVEPVAALEAAPHAPAQFQRVPVALPPRCPGGVGLAFL